MRPLAIPGLERSDAPRPTTAFLDAVPVGVLGGLIGLGGAEFRLPVFIGPLGYPARQAIPLNLAVSLVTLATSLGIRGHTLTLAPLRSLTTAIIALTSGALIVEAFLPQAGPGFKQSHSTGHALRGQMVRVLLVLSQAEQNHRQDATSQGHPAEDKRRANDARKERL